VYGFSAIQYDNIIHHFERIERQMQNDKAALDAKLTELGETISGVSDRVTDLLNRLAAAAPGFAEEITSVQADIDKLKGIAAPATAPAETPSAITTTSDAPTAAAGGDAQVTS
jgi:ABC-type transporter Mla subunit MlaD